MHQSFIGESISHNKVSLTRSWLYYENWIMDSNKASVHSNESCSSSAWTSKFCLFLVCFSTSALWPTKLVHYWLMIVHLLGPSQPFTLRWPHAHQSCFFKQFYIRLIMVIYGYCAPTKPWCQFVPVATHSTATKKHHLLPKSNFQNCWHL